MRKLSFSFGLAVVLGTVVPANAVENGIVEYPIGVNTVNPAFVLPPTMTVPLNCLEG